MKKICTLFFALTVGVSLIWAANDDSGSCGANLIYSFVGETGVLSISGTGAMNDYGFGAEPTPWHSYRSEIKGILFSDEMTTIGTYAFDGCTLLTAIYIPDEVTSIGNAAFYGCTGLQHVTIPGSVATIGSSAFYNCTAIKSIKCYIESPVAVSETVFNGVDKNTCVLYVPSESVATYSSTAGWSEFANIIPVPGTVWMDLQKGDLIKVNDQLEISTPYNWYVNGPCFEKARSPFTLVRADVQSQIIEEKEDGQFYLFRDAIGTYYLDAPLYRLPVTATSDGLLVTGTEVEEIDEKDYYNYKVASHEPFGYCEENQGENLVWAYNAATGELTISGSGVMADWVNPKDVPWICYRKNIVSLNIETGVTTIGRCAFEGCIAVTDVQLPNGLTEIGSYAFRCQELKTVTIPASVTRIKENAFYECQNMTDVYCYPNATALNWSGEKNDFKSDGSTKLHVKPSQLSNYQLKFSSVLNVTYVGDLPETPTAVESISGDSDVKVQKIIRDGQIFILRDNKKYNALGVEVK